MSDLRIARLQDEQTFQLSRGQTGRLLNKTIINFDARKKEKYPPQKKIILDFMARISSRTASLRCLALNKGVLIFWHIRQHQHSSVYNVIIIFCILYHAKA